MGEINLYDKILIRNKKKIWKSKYAVGMEFTACQGKLMPEGILTSFTTYCYFSGRL